MKKRNPIQKGGEAGGIQNSGKAVNMQNGGAMNVGTAIPGALSLFMGLILILLSAACKKEKGDITDPVPTILSVTVSPTTVVEYEDSIIFTVEYRDGDGDLGENEPDAHNLFLTDNRINATEAFRIRELAPSGADIPITGTLRVVLRNTGITNGSASQTVDYTLYIKDRAGNESERIVTDPITVTR